MPDVTTAADTGAAEQPAHSPSQTGVNALVTMTPPADTPARLSTTEAARLLASLRKPKQQTSAPERPPAPERPRPEPSLASGDLAAGTESPPAQAEDDAAPDAQAQAPGETESADTAAEQPTIEPPRSWTKEAKERWQSLPRDTQEYLASREQERERELRRGQNEAAEARKAVEAERAAVAQARQQYEAALPQLFQTLQSQQAGQFADIKTMADVERMAAEDWPRYLQWDVAQKKLAAVQQEYVATQQRQQEEQRQKFAEFAKREDSLFVEKVPDMADPKKAAEMQAAAMRVLDDIGFDEGTLQRAWATPGEFSLRDHRVQMLIVDAVRWRDAQAKAKTMTAKPVPPVQRPGTAQPRGAAEAQAIQNLNNQLERSSGVNQLRAAARLVAARRAAAR